MPPRTTTALLSAALCSAAPAALASTDVVTTNPDSPQVVESIVVVGSREAARRTGGSAAFIDAAELRVFDNADVNRVLRQVPGVALQEEDGFGLRPNIGIRGSGTDRSGRVAVMEDGVLIAPAPYAAPAAYYFPRMARMSGVEVVKGPGAIKYGPLTTGGAIGFFSTPIPEGEAGDFAGRASILVGDDSALQAHAWAGGWAGVGGGWEVGGLIELLRERNDGFKRLDNGGPTGFEIDDAVIKLGLRDVGGRHALTFKYQNNGERSDETYLGLTLEDFRADPFRRYAGSQVDVMDVEHETFQLTYGLELTDRISLTTTAYRNETSRAWYKLNDVRNAAGTGWVGISAVLADPQTYASEMAVLRGAPGFVSPAQALRVRNNNRAYLAEGVQSVLTARFDTGALNHTLEVSARWHRDSEDRFQRDDVYRMADGDMILTTRGLDGAQENRVGEAEAWAFFVRDTIRMGALTVTPGLRYETIDLTRTNYPTSPPSRATPTSVVESNVDVWIPGVGVTYDLTPELRLVAGAHRGFANPGPGSSVDPETSWNYEAGVRFQRDALSIEAIAFLNDYDNLLGTCTASTGGGCAIGDQFSAGAVEVRGVEVAGRWDAGRSLGLSFGAPLSLVYTLSDGEFGTSFQSSYGPWGSVQSGDELPYLPRHQLTLNAGVDFGRWGVNVSANRVSAARAEAGSGAIADDQRIDARTLVDASARLDLTDRVELFGRVTNLTDEVYNVAFSPAGARPGAPRQVLAGVRMTF